MDHPLPWLRYVDAGDLDDDRVELDGMDVESPSGEHLGDIDGFVVDSESGRPYYVVVESGGWFKTKHFLLPVGHARLDADNEVLRADIDRATVERFPGFDRGEFDRLTADDLKRMNDETCRAIEGVAVAYAASEPYSAAWDRPDFRYPEWWRSRPAGQPVAGRAPAVAPPPDRRLDPAAPGRDAVVGRADPSPHFDGRAQPGDVLGVETGGERTYVGDTAEDENRRREDAERAADKNDR